MSVANKTSLSSTARYESSGDALLDDDPHKTFVEIVLHGYYKEEDIELCGRDNDDTDDNSVPVQGYYYAVDNSREYCFLVYSDGSWGSNSD